jgi:hypothetical protein
LPRPNREQRFPPSFPRPKGHIPFRRFWFTGLSPNLS